MENQINLEEGSSIRNDPIVSDQQSQRLSQQFNLQQLHPSLQSPRDQNQNLADYSHAKLMPKSVLKIKNQQTFIKNAQDHQDINPDVNSVSHLFSPRDSKDLKFRRSTEKRRSGIQNQKDLFNILNLSKKMSIKKGESLQSNKDKMINLFRTCAFTIRGINALKEASCVNCWDLATERHLEAISDSSCYLQKKQNQVKKYYKVNATDNPAVIYQKPENENLFSADDNKIFLWSLVTYLLYIYQILIFPIKTSWDLEIYPLYWTIIPLIIQIIDMFINFNTSIYQQGLIITDKKKIIKNYFQYQFWVNFITITFLIFSLIFDMSDLNIVYILRLAQISSTTQEIDERLGIQHKYPKVWTLIKLIIQILYSGHLFGSGFLYIGISEISDGATDTWLDDRGLTTATKEVQYLNSIYFTFITMITVGYGDVTPKTQKEKIYVIFMTLISSGQFAYTINTIQTLFQEEAKKQAMHKERKQTVQKYMTQRKISGMIQQKVYKYLDYIQHKENEKPEKGLVILDQISQILKEEVFQDYYGKILKNCKLLKKNFSNEFLQELSLQMQENLFGPGELIFNFDDDDAKMYFLINGQVEVYLENENTQNITRINIYNEGDFFGSRGFFSQQGREYSARSIATSNIVYCTREAFIKIIKNYQKDFEVYCQLKDQINIYGAKIYEYCYACDAQKHTIINCPLIHLQKSKKFVLLKHRYTYDHVKRGEIIRKKLSYGALKNNSTVKKALKKKRKNFIKEIQNKNKFQKIKQESSSSEEENNEQFQQKSNESDDSIAESSESDISFFRNTPGVYFREDGEQIILDDELDDDSARSINSQIIGFENSSICNSNSEADQEVNKDNQTSNKEEYNIKGQMNKMQSNYQEIVVKPLETQEIKSIFANKQNQFSFNQKFDSQVNNFPESLNIKKSYNSRQSNELEEFPHLKTDQNNMTFFQSQSQKIINHDTEDLKNVQQKQDEQQINNQNGNSFKEMTHFDSSFQSQQDINIKDNKKNYLLSQSKNLDASIINCIEQDRIGINNLINQNQMPSLQYINNNNHDQQSHYENTILKTEVQDYKMNKDKSNSEFSDYENIKKILNNSFENKHPKQELLQKEKMNHDPEQKEKTRNRFKKHMTAIGMQHRISALKVKDRLSIDSKIQLSQQSGENKSKFYPHAPTKIHSQKQRNPNKQQINQIPKMQIPNIDFGLIDLKKNVSSNNNTNNQNQDSHHLNKNNSHQQNHVQNNNNNQQQDFHNFQQQQNQQLENNINSANRVRYSIQGSQDFDKLGQLFYYDMDRIKEYQKYFYHCNASNVIKKVKSLIKSNRRKSIIEKKKDKVLQNFEKKFNITKKISRGATVIPEEQINELQHMKHYKKN